jgi:serine/threonine protein kinase
MSITKIGKYNIVRLVGEGGMATVYEGQHEMLGNKVAIKVLNPILSANAQIKERFRNEAKLMASLDHPNITKVIDFDEQPNQLSIVMEYLDGEDLHKKIKRSGSIEEGKIYDYFSQALSGLQYAHQMGIVHRDIKPSNIIILSSGQIKILDFGIAKLFGEGNEMTQTGTQMGTPVYMSPEQVKGEKSIDHRSDIYSLGVTMYYAIIGRQPYNAETDSQFSIFTKIVNDPLPPFSVNSRCNELVTKACHKNREERFQSCEEWKEALTQKFAGTGSPNGGSSSSARQAIPERKLPVQNKVVAPKIEELADMYIMAHAKYFESSKIAQIRESLMKLDESKLATLRTLNFKEPQTALILSLLLGAYGIDRFYIGDTGLGVGKLLTCGGLGLWAIIDWFTIQKATRVKNFEKLRPFLYG